MKHFPRVLSRRSPLPGASIALVAAVASLVACSSSRDDQPTTVRLTADPLVSCPAAFASAAPKHGTNAGFLSAGQERRFRLALPPPSFEGPRPTVVAFHGSAGVGATPDEFFQTGELERFVERGYIVIALESNRNGSVWPVWDDIRAAGDEARPNPDLAFFDEALLCVAAHHPVDRDRVIVAGVSAGASMANVVLQRRSEVLAGGVVASGLFELTGPPAPKPLDRSLVIVTWTGDTDVSHPDGREVRWVEQASLASAFYDAQPAVEQVNCRATPGQQHGWLPGLSAWAAGVYLDNPKGKVGGDLGLGRSPTGVQCSTDVFRFVKPIEVTCPAATARPHCQPYCQFIADCAIENATVGSLMDEQAKALGFGGKDNAECGGCVSKCEAVVKTDLDAEILGCMATAPEAQKCGVGIEGFVPIVDTLNRCCKGRADSEYCVSTCKTLLTNPYASSFFTTCVELAAATK